jgi:transcriptional regulator with XRE-family HTH domain
MNIAEKNKPEVGGAVGVAIKANRLEHGWSQVELATRAELSREFVSMVESLKRSPSLEALRRIAACFGKDPADLLKEVGDAKERLELALRLRNIALSEDTESLRKLLEFAQTLK